jgi:hypothetical protein
MRLSKTFFFTICSFRNLPNGKDKESECVVDVLDGKGLPDSLLFQETANLIRRMVHRCPHSGALNNKNRCKNVPGNGGSGPPDGAPVPTVVL